MMEGSKPLHFHFILPLKLLILNTSQTENSNRSPIQLSGVINVLSPWPGRISRRELDSPLQFGGRINE